MKKCYIVGAGEFFGDFSPREEDLVIAADGGYSALSERGIRCDLLVGDLDSEDSPPTDIEILRHPIEKDETDMHLAYLEGARRGYENFEIYGGTGGRSDHTFANYCLLFYIRERGGRARLHDKLGYAMAIENEMTRLEGEVGDHLSVFAFGGDALGVDIRGFKYSLTDGTLSADFPLGVSNEFISESGEIGVRKGRLLIISQKKLDKPKN